MSYQVVLRPKPKQTQWSGCLGYGCLGWRTCCYVVIIKQYIICCEWFEIVMALMGHDLDLAPLLLPWTEGGRSNFARASNTTLIDWDEIYQKHTTLEQIKEINHISSFPGL